MWLFLTTLLALSTYNVTDAVIENQWIGDESRSAAEGTNVTLWWAFGLDAGETFSRATVVFVQAGTSAQNSIALIAYSGLKQIAGKYQSRANITREGQNVSLILTNVTLSDDGSYSIRVVTSTDFLGKSKTTVLEVTVPPIIVFTNPINKIVVMNKSQPFSLSCTASGKPTPTLVWSKTSGSPLQFPNGTTLTVSSASSQHYGTYQCTATNKAGSDTATFVVVAQFYSITDAEITLDLNWNQKLSDPYSQEYQSLRMLLKNLITESYSQSKLLADVIIHNFRKGSVIARFQLIFTGSINDPLLPVQTFIRTNNNKLGDIKVVSLLSVTRLYATEYVDRNGGTIAALASIVAVLFVVLICLLIYIWWKLRINGFPARGRNQYESSSQVTQSPAVSIGTQNNLIGENNVQYMQLRPIGSQDQPVQSLDNPMSSPEYAPLSPSSRSWEVSRDQIDVNKVIGKGAFGQVAKGTATGLPGQNGKITVALKMLKGNASSLDKKDLLSELNLMKQLKPHSHVIRLLGCVTEEEPLMVIIEYVPYGDLLGYLRKSRGLNDTYYKDPDIKPKTNLTSKQLIGFAWQIADGMSYLASEKIVHRDLAARNVLVGEDEHCKITDFGLARDVHEEGFYEKKTKGRLPVKWMALESLLHQTYSTQSDLWSYGVVLYELFTIGGCPYPKIPGRDITRMLEQGYRMPKPQHLDDHLYQVMFDCWQENLQARPTFETLKQRMKSFEENHQTYVNLKNYNEKLYDSVDDYEV